MNSRRSAVRRWGSSPTRKACEAGENRRSREGGRPVCRIRCVTRAIRRNRLSAPPKSTRIAQFGFR
ncbi:hypothetical protein C6P63_21545 [Burkholderia cenocepacia]|nr:hypothetical protein C6P63_21545 [Burkholderia cenocepacia]